MEKEALVETFARIHAGISSFQEHVTSLNINPTQTQVHKMEYHYKQILNKLEQVQYHLEQIEDCCTQLGKEDAKAPIRGEMVKQRVRQLNRLSPSFLEPNLKEFRQAESVFHKTRSLSRSEDNLISAADRICVDIDIDSIGKQMQAVSHSALSNERTAKPKVVGCMMKSPK